MSWPFGVLKEMDGSGKVSFTRGGISATRVYNIPCVFPDGRTWMDFVLALTGKVIADPNNGLPIQTYPDVFSDELNFLICQEVDVDPMTKAGWEGGPHVDGSLPWPTPVVSSTAPRPIAPRAKYKNAIVTAKYAPRSINESLGLSGQALSLPGSGVAFTGSDTDFSQPADSSLLVGEPVAQVLPQGQYSFEARQLLSPDFTQIINMIGNVNGNAYNTVLEKTSGSNVGDLYETWIDFDADGNPVPPPESSWPSPSSDWSVFQNPDAIIPDFFGFAPRTLLLVGCEGSRNWLPNGIRTWDITFRFQYNPKEWVKVFRPSTGKYEIVKMLNTNRYIYDPWDFSLLERYYRLTDLGGT